VSAAALLAFAGFTFMYLTWLERKVAGRFQDRYGPNRVGPFGLLQPIADGLKFVMKEDIIPTGADRVIHELAPILAVTPVLMLYLVLPFGRGMTGVDMSVGVLFFLGVSAVQSPVVIAAGLGARSKYSVLGSMRAAAQILSYEIPMVLVVVSVVMAAGTMSTTAIVEAQARDGWYILTPWGAVGMLVFLLCAVAESNRHPFDVAEAESELVAGFHTEFSGFKFGLFQMAEFLGGFASCGLAVTLFLGGWLGPAFLPTWAWFMAKVGAMFFVLMWFRATLPRFRIDQLMAFAWLFLFPLSLLVILSSALWYFLPLVPALASGVVLLGGGYWFFSGVLLREYGRSSVPEDMTRVR
jgi:NADH-quinone oxidoreductase subunit H